MVRALFIVAVLFASCSSSDSEFEIKESEVPPNVMAAFKAKYPSARDASWEAEKEDGQFFFEVEFTDGNKDKEVRITPDGASVVEE
ncbi:hypothetical protein A4H97_14565 [Niastella yeongjuensis]|uniref:Uncharacterized protein n=1 Tax=Niastella yeongjuensis TaxID=354355 RepID=A0A1V9E410_9BACT|nr:hypothetical protein [Niastella yeongjuensis]OQP40829.1 hypothetical protein A4H97_14565 [Niastella yeongjuensis]SEP00314.1 hypothetical protein SAMN05660816_04138 [Niastella yeongjuensis]